jgi:hypothetical protein
MHHIVIMSFRSHLVSYPILCLLLVTRKKNRGAGPPYCSADSH